MPKPPPWSAALARADGTLAVIAEIKRRSPSAGEIAAGASAVERAQAYQAAGAERPVGPDRREVFRGRIEGPRRGDRSLPKVGPLPCPACARTSWSTRSRCSRPRQAGASAILLIVRALDDEEIRLLHGAAKAAGLSSLFEIHSEAELERAVAHGARLIGVNNRDLSVFTTDLSLSERLIPRFPAGVVAVSESGIHTPADAARVRRAGAHAVLVGESLMRDPDPVRAPCLLPVRLTEWPSPHPPPASSSRASDTGPEALSSGQNFLVDGNIVRKSLELAEVGRGDTVVEIGPGLGTLTEAPFSKQGPRSGPSSVTGRSTRT